MIAVSTLFLKTSPSRLSVGFRCSSCNSLKTHLESLSDCSDGVQVRVENNWELHSYASESELSPFFQQTWGLSERNIRRKPWFQGNKTSIYSTFLFKNWGTLQSFKESTCLIGHQGFQSYGSIHWRHTASWKHYLLPATVLLNGKRWCWIYLQSTSSAKAPILRWNLRNLNVMEALKHPTKWRWDFSSSVF